GTVRPHDPRSGESREDERGAGRKRRAGARPDQHRAHAMSEKPVEVSPSIWHREAAPDVLRCAVLTVSDTRTEASDASGALIKNLLTAAGHVIADYRIVKDEPAEIRDRLGEWTGVDGVDAILTNGGTGIANRDTTYDVIAGLLEKRLDGFGELFRMLSFAE